MTLLPKNSKKAIIAKDGLGKQAKGQLVFLNNFESDELLKIVSDKIILVKSIDKVLLFKLIALGALGIIVEELEDLDFIDLSEKPINQPLLVVASEDFKELEKYDKKDIHINGENKSIDIL